MSEASKMGDCKSDSEPALAVLGKLPLARGHTPAFHPCPCHLPCRIDLIAGHALSLPETWPYSDWLYAVTVFSTDYTVLCHFPLLSEERTQGKKQNRTVKRGVNKLG